jgi:hypothetical protein
MTTKSIGISADADGTGDGRLSAFPAVSRRLLLGGAAGATLTGLGAAALPAAAATGSAAGRRHPHLRRAPLWRVAAERGLT